MGIKTIIECDRCGVEVKNTSIGVELRLERHHPQSFVLCPACDQKFITWMQGKP